MLNVDLERRGEREVPIRCADDNLVSCRKLLREREERVRKIRCALQARALFHKVSVNRLQPHLRQVHFLDVFFAFQVRTT